ncbi:unnamed protein product [Hermetia illucens]|uniref:Protein tweety homolog n=1 Tax=Hermetia illucens TaxID=343691 RepID=A0A7R8UUR9_HERIL|nr:unnamed protein product [Hermetia illucens]
MDQPSILVRILHSVPHVNATFQRVNDTFNPDSEVYLESLGILASIPAVLLILSLLGLLLYLLTRCCDRKQRKPGSQRCQNCTIITITLLCCAAIGLGLYGNDDFHNGLLQAFSSGRKVESLVGSLKKQTETIRNDLEGKVQTQKLQDAVGKPSFNQTAVLLLLDTCQWVKDNTSRAVISLDMVLYFMKPLEPEPEISLRNILNQGEFYESIRWPATLGYLTVLLLLCTVLVIGLARRSRCALIFFSVLGLYGIIICWLLAGIYLATSVSVGDFCMRPTEFMCRQVATRSPDDLYYLNCGTLRNRFILRLNESRDYVEKARESVLRVARMSREIYPRIDITTTTEALSKDLEEARGRLSVLTAMLDRRSIDKHYADALKGVCGGGLLGLSLMMAAGLLTAILLTILVYADSHAWIYLTKKPVDVDKSETAPLFQETTRCTTSPNHTAPSAPLTSTSSQHKNGSAGYRGLVPMPTYDSESPPPEYNDLVHGKSY